MSSKYYMFIHVGQYELRQVNVNYVPEDALDGSDLETIRNSKVVPSELMKKIRNHHQEGDSMMMRQNVKEVFMLVEDSAGYYYTDSDII